SSGVVVGRTCGRTERGERPTVVVGRSGCGGRADGGESAIASEHHPVARQLWGQPDSNGLRRAANFRRANLRPPGGAAVPESNRYWPVVDDSPRLPAAHPSGGGPAEAR